MSKPQHQFKDYWQLWQQTKTNYSAYAGADLFNRKLLRGDFLVLKNNFSLKVVSLFRGRQPAIMATHYLPHSHWPGPECIGSVCLRPDVTAQEIESYWKLLEMSFLGRKVVGPLNGHHYLGFSLPDENSDPKKIGVLTASSSPELYRFFKSRHKLSTYRNYRSFETPISPEQVEQLQQKSKSLPLGFSVRSFNFLKPRRELTIFNNLVNRNFLDHFDFCPLSDSENYEIMVMMLPLLRKGEFQFLCYRGKEIGFFFGLMDYNQIWNNGSDLTNITNSFIKRHSLSRARAIHVCIDKEFRGQGLVKFLRNDSLLNLYRHGARTVENSYIDEGNQASIGNVQSTGGKPLHNFQLFNLS